MQKMKKEVVGNVTQEEKYIIQDLFSKVESLKEIIPMLNTSMTQGMDCNVLYEKVVKDMAETKLSMQKWWQEKSLKYNWKSSSSGNWNIDFQTNEIYLLTQD
jgi:CXXX repeat modification system protein